MPTPSGVTVEDVLFSQAAVEQDDRWSEDVLVAPVGVGSGELPPEPPTTRSWGFIA